MSFWKPGAASGSAGAPSSSSVIVDEGGGGAGSSEVVPASPFNFSRKPLDLQRQALPIARHRRQILYAIEKYPVTIIVGETGSGKSTQLPQYLRENGWSDSGFSIVCTQPRRIAAQTLAARVAKESGCELGTSVGYTVRFDDVSSPATEIRYVTDGMLLREATVSDPLLSRYSVVILDEAHERNLNTDALLGVIRKIRRKRPELRVIVCSATINAEEFLDFFIPKSRKQQSQSTEDAESSSKGRKRRRRWGLVGDTNTDEQHKREPTPPTKPKLDEIGTIISIDGRQYPVDVMYSQEPVSDIVRSTVDTALRIHFDEGGASSIGDGDILCFLPSGEDIDRAVAMAEDILPSMNATAGGKARRNVVFLPLYGSLPYQMQARVFQPRRAGDDSRRVIFATNLAETSVTVPNIASVIDAGFAKMPYFDADTGFDRLITCPISRASARQRAGRAGRIRAGKCYRLYTERDMAEKMEATTQPEVLRTNLTSFILTLKAMGVDNILSFDLMSIPSVAALSHGLECLYALKAIDRGTNLTQRGNQMAEFPTEPRVSTMLLESLGAGCAEEALAVAASLQVRALFHQPRTERQQIEYDAAMPEIADRSGDHVTHVNLMELFQRAPLSAEECRDRFINRVALKRALEVKAQLRRFLRRYGSINGMENALDEDRSKSIRKCVTSGFFFNTAKLGSDGRYYTLRGRHMVSISKASVLDRYGESTEYIIFCETYDGSRGGIESRNCSAVEGRWLRELAPHYWAN